MAGQLEPGVKFVETYRCPHCQAGRSKTVTGRDAPRLRCPNCGFGRGGRRRRLERSWLRPRRKRSRPTSRRHPLLILDDTTVPDRKSLIPISAALSFKASSPAEPPGSRLARGLGRGAVRLGDRPRSSCSWRGAHTGSRCHDQRVAIRFALPADPIFGPLVTEPGWAGLCHVLHHLQMACSQKGREGKGRARTQKTNVRNVMVSLGFHPPFVLCVFLLDDAISGVTCSQGEGGPLKASRSRPSRSRLSCPGRSSSCSVCWRGRGGAGGGLQEARQRVFGDVGPLLLLREDDRLRGRVIMALAAAGFFLR